MARVGLLVFTLLGALVGAGCSAPCGTLSNPCAVVTPDPPQVFLIAPESNPVGTSLKLKGNVVGCLNTTQLQILNNGKFLLGIDNPTKFPVDLDLPPSLFNSLYQSLGIAVKLTLTAKGVCDDGRTNTSTPVAVNFFPVQSVTPPAAGNSSALPDVFVAEGGVAGAPTTFVGCVGTSSGTGLARFDTDGNAINANLTPPFACSYNSIISEKNKATGFRWLLEPQVGVFSFDSSNPQTALNIKAYKKGTFMQLGIGPDGDAIVWDSRVLGGGPSLFKYSKSGGANANSMWPASDCGTTVFGCPSGIMAATPVVSQGEVYTVMWVSMLGQFDGDMTVQKFSYGMGPNSGGAPIATYTLASITYGEFNQPKIPAATFNADGTLVYFAFENNGSTQTTSGVVACASNSVGGCGPSGGAKWVSALFDDVIEAAVPYSSGSLIAAIGSKKTYFLSAFDGHIVNVFDAPIEPDGALVTMSAQPGNGTEFYLMNGPSTGAYPTEIVAVDSPLSGELWRVQINGGDQPTSAVNLAIDEGNNVWLRIGINQVRPLTLSQYRMVKGTNLAPP